MPGNDLLTFEGLAVGLGDFTANGTNYTYTLQNDSGATSTLVTAVSGNGEPVSINGQALSTGGSATVAIPNSGTTDIVVGIGAKTYTLTILRNSGGEHTHSYGSEWKYDADNHWHECSCGDKKDVAAHTASDWIIDTPATATADGTKHKECTVCGYTMATETIPATGGGEHTHSYGSEWKYDADNHWHECSCGDKKDVAAHTASDWIIDTPATATADGTKHKECTVCGYTMATETIPATGGGEHTHSYGSEWKYDADNHWHECSCGDKKDVAAHTASDWIIDTPATATADGTKHKECTVCGYTMATETIPATGGGEHTHSYGSEWKYDADNHWHECSCGDKKDVAAHTASDWIIDTPATANADGTKHKECTVCGYTMAIETIPAAGGGEHTHSYGSEWKYDADNHWHECSCGDKKDVAAHTASDWIIDTPATATADGTKHKECTVCGYTMATETIPATGGGEHTHSYGSEWKYDADNHWHECSCGDKADKAAHDFKWIVDKEATATQNGSKHEECKVCGCKKAAVEIPATGTPTDPDSSQTGDNSNMLLWIALLFISGGAVIGITVYSKKKKENAE